MAMFAIFTNSHLRVCCLERADICFGELVQQDNKSNLYRKLIILPMNRIKKEFYILFL